MSHILHAPDLDSFLDADRRYFIRRPDRTCRLRRAHPAEMATFARVNGSPLQRLPADGAWFVLVSQVRPGARVRRPLGLPAGMETDLSEADCLQLKSLILVEDPAKDLAAAFESLAS
jgi:hypothetical protein